MKRDGFTIIEVMIFVAISGLMLAMAMIGSGNLARQTRFSDTVNSFHSTLQRQYEEVVNGVNTRGTAAGDDCSPGTRPVGTDTCLLLGKVITFNPVTFGTTATVRTVVDTAPTADTSSGSAQALIVTANPQILANSAQTIELAWGASFQNASRETGVTNFGDDIKTGSLPPRAIINSVAFLRSPAGSEVVPYYFFAPNPSSEASIQTALEDAVGDYLKTTGVRSYICITNRQEWSAASAPVAAIVLGVGRGSVAIDTNFSPQRAGNGECA